ncbi:MAG: outer membrane beta-barrel protein [Candidatus Marinimicrobia bacterium]|nr:outer membrane beta-barrel protein [Candidatus Neomarinimicrobiota bacterium]
MKKMFGILGIIVIGFFMTDSANAQFFPPDFRVYGGFSFPAGDFSSSASADIGDYVGGRARLGFAVGVEVDFPLSKNERLSWMNSMIIASQPTSYINEFGTFILQGGDVQTTSWLLAVPLSGIKYKFPISEFVDIIAFGQIGALYGQSPEINIEDPAGDTFTQKTANGTGIAFGTGAGLYIHDLISVNLRMLFGEPEYEANTTFQGEESTFQFIQKTTVIQLMAGVSF